MRKNVLVWAAGVVLLLGAGMASAGASSQAAVRPPAVTGASASQARIQLPAQTLRATRVGGLPGGVWASGLDGDLVVGTRRTRDGGRAMVVDLSAADPTPVGFGPNGPDTWGLAVHGSLAAGLSLGHAFVVDLADAGRPMVDLGTAPTGWDLDPEHVMLSNRVLAGIAYEVGPVEPRARIVVADLSEPKPSMHFLPMRPLGQSVSLTGLDGSVVVGHYVTRVDGRREGRAFYYDVAAPSPAVVALGTLAPSDPRAYTRVTGVSGTYLVGSTTVPSGAQRAFVYDLSARPPAMRSIGHRTVEATAIDGSVVVGTRVSRVPGPFGEVRRGHAFAYDLAAARPTVRDLGAWGHISRATDVDGHTVVGYADRLNGLYRPFAYNLDRPTATPVDLGSRTLGMDEPDLLVISGDHVLVNLYESDVRSLHYTNAPSLAFTRINTTVQEDVGSTSYTVTRSGNAGLPVTVRVAVARGIEPWWLPEPAQRRDYVVTPSTLRFGSGETHKRVRVRIVNDTNREESQHFLPVLISPAGGAVLGTPHMAAVVIRESDTQPDAWIGPRPSRTRWDVPKGYLGNDLYTTAKRQTLSKLGERRETTRFFIRLYKDAGWSSPYLASTFTLHATRAPDQSIVRYYHQGTDITAALHSRPGLKVSLKRGDYRFSRWWPMRIEITPGPRADIGSHLVARITATWKGDGVRADAVKAVVHVLP